MTAISRKHFLNTSVLGGLAVLLEGWVLPWVPASPSRNFRVRLLRHATLLVEVNDKKLLVDPMLSSKEALDPIPNATNDFRIPMVDLPISESGLNELIDEIDAVIITHTHRDHWDIAAQRMIPKNKLIICQPADVQVIKTQGFVNIQAVDTSWEWGDIMLHRTTGQHGTGEIGKRLGPVSGFVIQHGKTKIYIAGDTIWCNDVMNALKTHVPDHVIVNGGGARYKEGDAITMTTEDVKKLAEFTNVPISVVHLETINHCLQRRSDFRAMVSHGNLIKRVGIPDDGEWINIK